MNKCEYCDEDLLSGTKFCPHCGAKVERTKINEYTENTDDVGSFGLGFFLGIMFGFTSLIISFFFCKRKTRKGIRIGFLTRLLVELIYYGIIFGMAYLGYGEVEYMF